MGVGVRWLSTRYGGNKASAGLCKLLALSRSPVIRGTKKRPRIEEAVGSNK